MSKKLLKSVSLILVLLLCMGIGTGCEPSGEIDTSFTGTSNPTEEAKPTQEATDMNEDGKMNDSGEENEVPKGDAPMIKITMADGGVMTFKLYPEKAPITVENFISLAKDGFYDGLTFHRIIEGFMIQGGDPQGTGMGGSGKSIKGEFSANGVNNDLKHVRGVISMARSQMPDSASSQFFIMHEDAPHLDGQYAAFGMMIDGYDVLDKIATTPVSFDGQTPLEKPVIDKVTVE